LTESRFKDREYRRELNENAIVEEVKRREAMCSELKSALLLKSINSIIYREYEHLVAVWPREIDKKILWPSALNFALKRTWSSTANRNVS